MLINKMLENDDIMYENKFVQRPLPTVKRIDFDTIRKEQTVCENLSKTQQIFKYVDEECENLGTESNMSIESSSKIKRVAVSSNHFNQGFISRYQYKR